MFAAILPETQRRLIEYVELFHGGLDSTSIYVREVVKYVISAWPGALDSYGRSPGWCSYADSTVDRLTNSAGDVSAETW